MKVSTEIENNFGYEKITQLVEHGVKYDKTNPEHKTDLA
jgi:hypothetical protein